MISTYLRFNRKLVLYKNIMSLLCVDYLYKVNCSKITKIKVKFSAHRKIIIMK